MANAHMEKRKQGLVQGHGSGYGGSGFKFDKDEDQKVKAARRQKAKVRSTDLMGDRGTLAGRWRWGRRWWGQVLTNRCLELGHESCSHHRPAHIYCMKWVHSVLDLDKASSRHGCVRDRPSNFACLLMPQEFGIIEADEQEEAGSSSDDDIRPAGANAAATAAAAAAATAPAAANGLPSAAVPAGAPASAPSAPLAVPKFLPAQPGQVFPGQAVTQDSSSILAAARQAAEAAAAKVGGGAAPSVLIAAAQQAAQRAAELAAKMTGAAIPTSGVGGSSANTSLMATAAASASAGLGLTVTPAQSQRSSGFEAELEINDFPQQARYRVTHKGYQNEITELTGAAVTTKGIYVKSGEGREHGRRRKMLLELCSCWSSVACLVLNQQSAHQHVCRVLFEVSFGHAVHVLCAAHHISCCEA